MKEKINQYVEHYFRFDKRHDLASLKSEIIANLCDRYDESLAEGLSEQEAYIKTVKSMGDFNVKTYDSDIEPIRALPSLPEYLLVTSVVFAIFSFVLIFLNSVVGGILTAISIASYAVGGYYLYAKAMHAKTEELDIERHKNYLKSIFKYMKTSFAFWSFNLAYLVALAVNMLSQLIIFFIRLDVNPDLVRIQETMRMFVFFSIFSFVISFVVFIIISNHIYHRLETKYYILTGEKVLSGKIKASYDYLNDLDLPKSSDLMRMFSYIFGLGSIVIFLFSHVEYQKDLGNTLEPMFSGTQLATMFRLLNYEVIPTLALIIGLTWIIMTYVIVIKFKKSTHWIFQAYIVFLVMFILYHYALNEANILRWVNSGPIFVVMPAFLSLLYYTVYGVLWIIKVSSKKKPNLV